MKIINNVFAVALMFACGYANAQSIFDFVADANSQERGFATSYATTVGGITLTVTAARP